jgi:phenylacetate-CoA oxygenase PaaJ subunit
MNDRGRPALYEVFLRGKPGLNQAHGVTGLFACDRMAYDVAGGTPHPELPMVTIADLGIMREVRLTDSTVTVTITPAGGNRAAVCEISADISQRLEQAGFGGVTIRIQLDPAWVSDWITSEGRRKLASAGIMPPWDALWRGGFWHEDARPPAGIPT